MGRLLVERDEELVESFDPRELARARTTPMT
jgi:hypothetical protein